MTKKKIKFLASGDFHSDLNFMEEIKKKVDFSDIDFIVLIGDISDKNDDFGDILSVFGDKQIFMTHGNHETRKHLDILKNHYNVHHVGENPVIIEDKIALFGSEFLELGEMGTFEEVIFEDLVNKFDLIKNIKYKIHLTHIPPAEIKLANMSPFYPMIAGSHPQRLFLEKFSPDLTLVGHIHESSGLEEMVNKTKVVNVGKTYKIFEF